MQLVNEIKTATLRVAYNKLWNALWIEYVLYTMWMFSVIVSVGRIAYCSWDYMLIKMSPVTFFQPIVPVVPVVPVPILRDADMDIVYQKWKLCVEGTIICYYLF